MTNYHGKTVLVTGATGGIGKAVCAELAKQGYSLILTARNAERLAKACDDLRTEFQGNFDFIVADMAHRASTQAFAASLQQLNVDLHGVVLMPPQIAPTKECLPSPDVWLDVFNGSFVGPLEVLKHAMATMKPRPRDAVRCKVVVVSGVSSAHAMENYATSNSLRCAWRGQEKTLALTYGPQGIHVNTLSLGGTLTEGYQAKLAKRAADAGVSFEQRLLDETDNVPLKKYGTPKEVAVSVATLLGPFTDHMTGQNFLHEGGFVRSY